MSYHITKGIVPGMIAFIMVFNLSCKKSEADGGKMKAPVRTYLVTARIDKKGANSDSEGTAVFRGAYSEESKLLVYSLEYQDIVPQEITLRSGAKGSYGSLVKELYNRGKEPVSDKPIAGSLILSPLQERNLLKGQWFVAINTLVMIPEISGIVTLKQM